MLSDYVDWDALGRIAVTSLAIGAFVVAAFSGIVVGFDRRSLGRNQAGAVALISLGTLVCLAGFAVGMVAMLDK
jgi:hypothetical protein